MLARQSCTVPACLASYDLKHTTAVVRTQSQLSDHQGFDPCHSLALQVQLLTLSEIERQLTLAVGQLMTKPPAAMQALLDHSHDSYARDLDAAAKQLARLSYAP